MIKKYRKKPIEIEAVQWTGDNLPIIVAFMQKVPQYDLTMGNEKVFILRNILLSIYIFILKDNNVV